MTRHTLPALTVVPANAGTSAPDQPTGIPGQAREDSHAAREDSHAARDDSRPVLTARNVSITYEVEPPVDAVREVSLTLHRGEILGLAGESGCGKTTFAYGVNRLLKAPAVMTSGEVTFHDRSGVDVDVTGLTGEQLRRFRWDKVSMVFQGSMNSLNPVMNVRSQLADVFTTHRPGMPKAERDERCAHLLELVGVDPGRLSAFPHELSGGMRQRVMIAMALALDPQVMIMDEPTTALDVVVQRGIIRQIMRLRERLGFAVIFITHDLPLLIEISDRIAIMRDGRIVEEATAEQVYRTPQHAYTRQLLSSFPSLTGERGGFVRGGAA
jgi:peptide/nickel transport system ATP-binding protein